MNKTTEKPVELILPSSSQDAEVSLILPATYYQPDSEIEVQLSEFQKQHKKHAALIFIPSFLGMIILMVFIFSAWQTGHTHTAQTLLWMAMGMSIIQFGLLAFVGSIAPLNAEQLALVKKVAFYNPKVAAFIRNQSPNKKWLTQADYRALEIDKQLKQINSSNQNKPTSEQVTRMTAK